MRIYDLNDKDGRLVAFEIGNIWISRRGVEKVVRSIPDATVVRGVGRESWVDILSWWKRDEYFCEFDLRGTRFVAWEPWGDSSRYWIGPEPARPTPEVATVRDAFAAAQPAVMPVLCAAALVALAIGPVLRRSGIVTSHPEVFVGGGILLCALGAWLLWKRH
jgi:hypothetical protein